jgi:hypothetical protein
MGILLGFAPFILFALLTGVSVSLALWVAFAAAFAIGIRDFMHDKRWRLLDGASLALFAGLAIYAGFINPSISVEGVRFAADAAMSLIALLTILLRKPYTLDYSRDNAPEREWAKPRFIRLNYFLTLFWCLSFAVMAAADGLTAFTKVFPMSLDVAIVLATVALAIIVTVRLPMFSNKATR